MLGWLVFGGDVWAAGECRDRYVVLVNPVRNRELWADKTLKPIVDQYGLVKKNSFGATWLVQSDVWQDGELKGVIKHFDEKQELGVFLEISKKLAEKARVYYPTEVEWYRPGAVFLSGYKPSERKRLIDKMVEDFRRETGKGPESAGAWWVDSFSANYLREKYKIKNLIIVADQKTTDNYGVWGQWWGVPYYPARANILTPANSKKNKLDVLVIQWAQRDLTRAGGEGTGFSNYSLQANDYTDLGLKTDYFASLVDIYQNCENRIGQVTMGLEVGQEGVGKMGEYQRQLDYLKKFEAVTMREFGEKFREIYPNWPTRVVLKDETSEWEMTPEYRKNAYLEELTIYNQKTSFNDNWVADKSSFLERKLPINNKNITYIPYWIGVIIVIAIWQRSGWGAVMSLLIWWPIFRSFGQSGWWVYFGPTINNLGVIQALLAVAGVAVFKKAKLNEVLVVGGMTILNYLRATTLEGIKYIGFLVDSFRLVGINSNWQLINRDFEGYVANSMLKFRGEWGWDRWWVWLVVYPLIIVVLGKLLKKLPIRIRVVVRIVLVGLLIIYAKDLLMADPMAVEAMR